MCPEGWDDLDADDRDSDLDDGGGSADACSDAVYFGGDDAYDEYADAVRGQLFVPAVDMAIAEAARRSLAEGAQKASAPRRRRRGRCLAARRSAVGYFNQVYFL